MQGHGKGRSDGAASGREYPCLPQGSARRKDGAPRHRVRRADLVLVAPESDVDGFWCRRPCRSRSQGGCRWGTFGGCAALVVAAAAWISRYGSVADNVAENIVEGAVGDCTPGAAAEEAINNYFNGECAILNPQGAEFGRVGSTDLTSATGTMSG